MNKINKKKDETNKSLYLIAVKKKITNEINQKYNKRNK